MCSDKHPANAGLDFSFDGSISETVLRNYLSRAMTLGFFNPIHFEPEQYAYRMQCRDVIRTCGVKYVGRANCAWIPDRSEIAAYPAICSAVREIHEEDPDIILEACIFETAYPCFSDFEIPEFVCRAFGEPYTGRHFCYEKMLFPDGTYVDHWEKDGSVPDMNQRETQMWFYFRGCLYIDLGFESLHYGQVLLIGEQDEGYRNWSKVMNLIRDYAKQHARRRFVLLNAHTHGMLDESGRLMFDFHCYPIRPVAVAGDTPYHAPDGVHPQRCELIMGWGNSIFGRSMGGVTHSGWETASLPYFVEIDNYGCQPPALLNTPVDYYPWGYDECSWFAQQPKEYRAEWLRYVHDWIRENDPAGALEMLGLRGISVYDEAAEGKLRRSRYFIADPSYDDCGAVRSIWCAERGHMEPEGDETRRTDGC